MLILSGSSIGMIETAQGFWENPRRNFASKGSFLYEEAEILLREEFREPRNCTLILRAIGEGKKGLVR